MARRPPEGKEEASGSPLISSLPENSIMTPPSGAGEMKLSCFSAVMPVSGWNQCVKCVTPFSIAQSFIAPATASATSLSSRSSSSMVFLSERYTFSGRVAFMTRSSKTRQPKYSETELIFISSSRFSALRCVPDVLPAAGAMQK